MRLYSWPFIYGVRRAWRWRDAYGRRRRVLTHPCRDSRHWKFNACSTGLAQSGCEDLYSTRQIEATGHIFAASESLWIVLLKFDAVNGAGVVGAFLALLGTLFTLFALSALVVGKLDDQRGALLVIAAGAVAFRLTMLPAGLPAQLSWSEKVEALRAD